MRLVVITALVAVAYFAAAQVGYAFAIPQGTVTLWPPAGVMLGILLLGERRDWPAIVAGGFVGSLGSDIFSGHSMGGAAVAAAVNSVESLLAAWLVRRRLGPRIRLSNLRSALVLTGVAVVFSNALTACLGAALLYFTSHTPIASGWFNWWVGGGLGMLTVSPLILAWVDVAERRPPIRRVQVLEAAILGIALSQVSHIAFGSQHDWPVEPGPYAVFP
ncbi:MAG: MASE1 domain-containing protein, partial [Gemmatimonadota bacterium]